MKTDTVLKWIAISIVLITSIAVFGVIVDSYLQRRDNNHKIMEAQNKLMEAQNNKIIEAQNKLMEAQNKFIDAALDSIRAINERK